MPDRASGMPGPAGSLPVSQNLKQLDYCHARHGAGGGQHTYSSPMRRLLGFLLVPAVFFGLGWWVFLRPFGPSREIFVEIAPGTGTRAIARALTLNGIIRTPYGFDALALAGGSLKAGEYRFAGRATVGEVFRRIARGDVYTVALTIPEGANIFDIAARVEAAGLGAAPAFLAAERAETALIARFDPHAATLEGYLFPSTYRFGRHAGAPEMLRTMVREFQTQAAALGFSEDVHQVVTLASLLERETPIEAERPMVASVFRNRLRRGMALDTDPTVIYAALLKGGYRGTIFQSDLQADSPYNTYKHAGLPPGPICNPGLVSLKAALHPAQTNYLYFVAAGADPQGRSRFAATMEEHQRNVSAYRAAVRGGR